MLLLLAYAHAHGTAFGAVALSVNPQDPSEIWAIAEGWGLVHTTDGGDAWEWICEDALGGATIYDVLATDDGAVVATASALLRVREDCSSETVPGFPEGAWASRLAESEAGYLVAGYDGDDGGVWSCHDAGCERALVGAGTFAKSLARDGEVAWATLVHEETLAAELWRLDSSWELRAEWPEGDIDPRVLHAEGDRVLVWSRPRSDDATPGLWVSDDGGTSFRTTFETGYYTDPEPGFVTVAGRHFLGSVYGARTWMSDDGGESFEEVSGEAPAVRCGASQGGSAWVCGDHLADGVDVAVTTDGVFWTPVACLEEALVAACAQETCSALHGAFVDAGSYGGGQCDTVIGPAVEEGRCGCGGGAASAMLLGLLGRARRARPATPPRTPPRSRTTRG